MQARGGTKMLTLSAVSATDFLFCLIVSASSSAAFVYKGCNETIEYSNINLNHKEPYRLIMSEQMTIRWNSSADSKFFHCWVRFQDSSRKVVEISVKEIISTDQDKDSCKTSYLKISEWSTLDSKSNRDWLPVATVCSANRNRKSTRVRRWIRSPNAFVDFKYERPKQTGSYEFDVMFVNNDDDDKPLPYGHNERVEGKIQHTKCDWLIPVEECIGYCSVISPGYPNSYPDDVTCSYLLTNFDDSRVELKIGGKHFSGVFDLKQSDNCTEDYVQVYDGMSASNPLIGQFCGQFDSQNGLHLISSGSSLFLIFRTSSNTASGSDVPDDAPGRNSHSGFHFQAMERWKNYHENGKRKSNSICDWVFRSSDSISGDLHTPDYFLRGETTCRYDFVGVDYNDRTEVHIVIQHFQNSIGSSPSGCKEIVRIFDGSHEVKTLCRTVDVGCRRSELSTEIVDGGCRPEEYVHNMTHRNASVIFHRVSGQLSNPDPTWIYYRFWRQPVTTTTTEPRLHTVRRDFEKDYVQLDLRFVSKTSEEDRAHVRSSYSLYPGRPSNEDFLGDINSASNSQNSAYSPIFRIFYALSISQLLTATIFTDLPIYLQQFHHLRQFHHRILSG